MSEKRADRGQPISYRCCATVPVKGCKGAAVDLTVSDHPEPRYSYQTYRMLTRADGTPYRLPFLPIETGPEVAPEDLGEVLLRHIEALQEVRQLLLAEIHKEGPAVEPPKPLRRKARAQRNMGS